MSRADRLAGSYAQMLRHPWSRSLMLLGLVAKLPMAMVSLALVLSVNAVHGRELAGWSAAVLALALAVTGPARGRWVDRSGPRTAMSVLGLAQAAALLGLWASLAEAPTAVVLLCAALTGALTAPGTSVLRSLWSMRAPSSSFGHAAQAWESVTLDVVFILGPAAVAAVAGWTAPRHALLVVAVLGAATSVLLARAAGAHWRIPVRPTAPHPLPLRLLPVVALAGGSVGAITTAEMAAVGVADEAGREAQAGLLVALLSAGSILGGLVYGRTDPPGSRIAHIHAAAAAWVLGCLLGAWRGGLVWSAVALTVAGLGLAVVITAQYGLAAARAPESRRTEVYSWMATAGQIGAAVGAAGSGYLDGRQSFLLSAALMAVASVLAAVSGMPRPRWVLAPHRSPG
ncbi:MFS transporter [Kocuria oceani]|uniref:MFS transporter n=1 Tax=Kocuria oceani TaxID=988827 RepID=A0ABV9TH26_9MICC|nr:MFS transporter [Kocuria oceani]